MEDRNYRVNIKDIYVGDVIGLDEPDEMKVIKRYKSRIFLYSSGDLFEKLKKELMLSLDNRNYLIRQMNIDDNSSDEFTTISYHLGENGYGGCFNFRRSMLFTLDENKHANDLLYNSPHYPILNISPHDDCLKSNICIGHDTYEMYKLLKYFGYPEEIGYEDVLKIRNTFFTCDYVLDHCETYGCKETGIHETSFEIYDSKGKHRTFNDRLDDSLFPYCYFLMLEKLRDYYSYHSQCVNDSFKPCEEEGPIKSLGTLKKR